MKEYILAVSIFLAMITSGHAAIPSTQKPLEVSPKCKEALTTAAKALNIEFEDLSNKANIAKFKSHYKNTTEWNTIVSVCTTPSVAGDIHWPFPPPPPPPPCSYCGTNVWCLLNCIIGR